MRRRLLLALAVVFAAWLTGGERASGAGFALGVAAGEITSSSAKVWTRAPQAGTVTAELSTDRRFRRALITRRKAATTASDLTVSIALRALKPGTRYFYRLRLEAETSPVGSFETAPLPTTQARVRFALSGDADATPLPASGRPFFNSFEVYSRMAAEGNDFNVNLGDTIYSDSGVAGAPALSVPQKWAKYRQNLALPNLRRLRAATGLYSHWDDHEFVDDFSVAEHGREIYDAGRKAFLDYAPVAYNSRLGLYRTFRWGRNLELFFLDGRTFRDAKASAGGACNTAGRSDLAPTAPQAVRNAFASIAPALAQLVAQSCLDRIRDPSRTMLGAAQFGAFTRAVTRSTATWKVVLNEVPIHQFYALPYDRWEGYEAERLRLLQHLSANAENVVFLTTDTHANLAGEVRLSTLETSSPVGTGIFEVVTGPVATNTYAREIDGTLGAAGAGDAVTFLFLKPPPPRGVGLQCAATDIYSYAEVTVTATTLTIAPKDSTGALVRDKVGEACGPYRLAAR